MFGKISVGVRMIEIGPRISKSRANTANVYGLRSARRTIHIVRQSLLRPAAPHRCLRLAGKGGILCGTSSNRSASCRAPVEPRKPDESVAGPFRSVDLSGTNGVAATSNERILVSQEGSPNETPYCLR